MKLNPLRESENLGALKDILLELERQLRLMSLWDDNEPSAEQLASTAPFCIDTLSFPQWLQFVFLPRMRLIIDTNKISLIKSSIAPMVEEHFRGSAGFTQLYSVLLQVDEHINWQAEETVSV